MHTRVITFVFFLISLMLSASCVERYDFRGRGAYLQDSGGRRVATLDVGASLEVGARGLEPGELYEFDLRLDDEVVSFSRLSANARGEIEPFHLWFHSGVVGCSLRMPRGERLPRFMFRDFDEAQELLDGRDLTLAVRQTEGRALSTGEAPQGADFRLTIPVRPRRSAMVFPSTADGCLLNSEEVSKDDMHVSGRHFDPGEWVELSIVPNQRLWRVGDLVNDVTGEFGIAEPVRVQADENGRFTVGVWSAELQRRGAYDIVARRNLDSQRLPPRQIDGDDIVSYGSDTAYLLFLRYPPGGPLMDIAGRKLRGSPYFEFADSFAETSDDVWGAVDPTYVPAAHPGGSYAAYYVVDHRSVLGWAGNTSLSDVSGGAEIMRVKAGCINATDIVIWSGTKPIAEYDVVVNFGSTPAEAAGAFVDDFTYDDALDFLDGADQIGFRVAKDPYEIGSVPIGRARYSFDNHFVSLGAATDVDLRAVVRYPATVAGVDTPVQAGQHPIFIIEHGNHLTCNITRSGEDPYDLLIAGTLMFSNLFEYDDCPDRKPNHEGYMRLLEILASHGAIAVSIDAYDLTSCTTSGCRPQWIAERGDLILKHLEFWSELDGPGTYAGYSDPFAGRFLNHVDMSRISVSGHSRGGEASIAAFMRNAMRPIAQQFSITSVSSIAPVDGQAFIISDVPYFVILPAADGDVSNLSGVRIYDRAGGTTDQTVKSGIDVYGANHNYFSTIWAADQDDYTDLAPGADTSRPDYIAPADQQRLGESYLAAFTRSQLLGEDVYEDMLRGRLAFPSTAGQIIHHFRHEENHSKIDAGSAAGVPTAGTGVTETVVSGPSVHVTQAVRLSWSAAGGIYTYTIPAGDRDVTGFEVFSFRAAQTNSGVNPTTGQEFQVKLIGGGNERAVYTGRFDQIPAPYDRFGPDHNVMTTVRIPSQSFIINRSGVTLDNIDTVEFRFANPSQGEVFIDDVEFSR